MSKLKVAQDVISNHARVVVAHREVINSEAAWRTCTLAVGNLYDEEATRLNQAVIDTMIALKAHLLDRNKEYTDEQTAGS